MDSNTQRPNESWQTKNRAGTTAIGCDPQVQITRTIASVKNVNLREFLCTVMCERDVNRALTLINASGNKVERLPIERLRRAAETGRNRCLQAARHSETLYAAILIAGIESLLGKTVKPPYSTHDVMRSVVRDALHELEEKDRRQARDLRNCLGWGNEDDINGHRLQHFQNAQQKGSRAPWICNCQSLARR